MKKHSYGKLISMSWNWMIEILIRPFSLKKWIILGIIILLAGQMGFNFNIVGKKGNLDGIIDKFKKNAPVTNLAPSQVESPFAVPEGGEEASLFKNIPSVSDIISKLSDFFKSPAARRLIFALAIFLFLLVGFIIILWIWVRANFSFVFIDSVVRNDASLRIPFHRNKPQGNSYFWWSLIYNIIVLLVFGAIISIPAMQLIRSGAFTSGTPIDVAKILSIILPYVPLLIVTGILFLLITLFVIDFVLPIMYKKKIGIMKAWTVFLGIFKHNIGDILLYFLVKIGLNILALIVTVLIMIVGLIVLMVIGAIVALLGYLIYIATPAVAKGVVLVILILFGIPIYAFLGFLFNILFIPIPIFFRIFSIHFLGSIDESLDFFVTKTTEEVMLEESDEKYNKSMALVWVAVLSPILVAILGIILAVAIPNFVKVKGWPFKKGEWEIDKILPLDKIEMPPIPGLSKEAEPAGEPVTVYLKNGNVFKAKLIGESEKNVAFRIDGGTVVYPRSDILRIEKEE